MTGGFACRRTLAAVARRHGGGFLYRLEAGPETGRLCGPGRGAAVAIPGGAEPPDGPSGLLPTVPLTAVR